MVEDAACALGASYDGRMAGSLGTVAAFSFHPRKILTTGEGGVLTTNDERIESRVSLLCSHGGRRSDLFFEFEDAGFNYRLSDINAAIGIVQMSRLEDLLTRRRNVAALYSHLLGSVSGVNPPTEPARRTHAYQSYVTILEDGIDRDRVIRHLRDQGVESTLGTYALSQQPYMKKVLKVASEEFPVADRIARQSLTLPLHPEMSSDDVALVLHALKAALAAN